MPTKALVATMVIPHSVRSKSPRSTYAVQLDKTEPDIEHGAQYSCPLSEFPTYGHATVSEALLPAASS